VIAVLLYTLPAWVWAVTGVLLLSVGVIALVCCAAQLDSEHDQQEADMIRSFIHNGRPRW
jgi:hypothetical protein